MELLPKNQTIYTYVYFRQSNRPNGLIKEKRPELINCKGVVFVARPIANLDSPQRLFGMCCLIHHISQTLRLQITISFIPSKNEIRKVGRSANVEF